MTKNQLIDEIQNFIEYYSSDDQERMQMREVLLDYMGEVYEEPTPSEMKTYQVSITPMQEHIMGRETWVYTTQQKAVDKFYELVDRHDLYLSSKSEAGIS